MLPVIGRPLKAKPDTQSSEHGVVATNKHHKLSYRQIVSATIILLQSVRDKTNVTYDPTWSAGKGAARVEGD